MYNDVMKDLKDKMQPVVDITEINKKAAEKLFALQSACVTDLFNSSIAQMKALTTVKEPKSAVELQVQFFKTVESKLTDVAEKEIAALSEAKDQVSEIVEKSISELSEMPTTYFTDFSKFDMSQFADFSKFTDFSKFADLSAFTAAPVVTEEAEKKAPAKAAPRKAAPAATSAA